VIHNDKRSTKYEILHIIYLNVSVRVQKHSSHCYRSFFLIKQPSKYKSRPKCSTFFSCGMNCVLPAYLPSPLPNTAHCLHSTLSRWTLRVANFLLLPPSQCSVSDQTTCLSSFGGLVVNMLTSGTQVRGFKPSRICRIFRAKKSSTCLPSEGKWIRLSHVAD
jgi:hypothetical protein